MMANEQTTGLRPMLRFRWYRPRRGTDNDLRLQQQWFDPNEHRDSEPMWIDVPTVMED